METVDYIERALATGSILLSIHSFIRLTQFPITNFKVDVFRNTMDDGMPMYIDDVLIRWFGYTDVTLEGRRSAFIRDLHAMVPTPIINIDFCYIDDAQYKDFIASVPLIRRMYYPLALTRTTNPGTDVECTMAPRHHLLLAPKCLDTLMAGRAHDRVYRHYLDLRELSKVYSIYLREHTARNQPARPVSNYDANIEDWDYIDINDEGTASGIKQHLKHECGLDPEVAYRIFQGLPTDITAECAAKMFTEQYIAAGRNVNDA